MLVLKSFHSLRQWQASERGEKRGKNERAQSEGESRGKIDHFFPLLRPATQASLSMVISLALRIQHLFLLHYRDVL